MEIKKFAAADHYVRCVIYGASGTGKTVFAGTAPDVLFASSEAGLLSVVSTLGYNPDYVQIKSIEDLQELYKFVKKGGHKYKTLAIDSLSDINEIIKEGIEARTGEKMSRNDRGELFTKIKGIIGGLRALKMHVIIICQEKVNYNKDGGIESKVPMLNGKSATEIAYMQDIVGYIYYDKDGERKITTVPNQKLSTKDRTGTIGINASLDFKDWIEKVGSIEVEQEPETPPADIPPKVNPDAPTPPTKTDQEKKDDKMKDNIEIMKKGGPKAAKKTAAEEEKKPATDKDVGSKKTEDKPEENPSETDTKKTEPDKNPEKPVKKAKPAAKKPSKKKATGTIASIAAEISEDEKQAELEQKLQHHESEMERQQQQDEQDQANHENQMQQEQEQQYEAEQQGPDEQERGEPPASMSDPHEDMHEQGHEPEPVFPF